MAKKRKSSDLEDFWIFTRYIFLLLLAYGNLMIFYKIFTPLTINISFFVLKMIYPTAIVSSNTILFNSTAISLIPACIAGSAYYLLVILNLTTPMSLKTRVKSISFLILTFFLVNLARIIFFSILAPERYAYFDITHVLFWYIGSTVILVGLWFINVKLFKIKSVPVYSDIKSIIASIKK